MILAKLKFLVKLLGRDRWFELGLDFELRVNPLEWNWCLEMAQNLRSLPWMELELELLAKPPGPNWWHEIPLRWVAENLQRLPRMELE